MAFTLQDFSAFLFLSPGLDICVKVWFICIPAASGRSWVLLPGTSALAPARSSLVGSDRINHISRLSVQPCSVISTQEWLQVHQAKLFCASAWPDPWYFFSSRLFFLTHRILALADLYLPMPLLSDMRSNVLVTIYFKRTIVIEANKHHLENLTVSWFAWKTMAKVQR